VQFLDKIVEAFYSGIHSEVHFKLQLFNISKDDVSW